MTSSELRGRLCDNLGDLDHGWRLLKAFQSVGGTQESAVKVIQSLMVDFECHEDFLLDLLDYATGWCAGDLLIWS